MISGYGEGGRGAVDGRRALKEGHYPSSARPQRFRLPIEDGEWKRIQRIGTDAADCHPPGFLGVRGTTFRLPIKAGPVLTWERSAASVFFRSIRSPVRPPLT